MALIPVAHEHQLTSPAEAEAFFRALGERRIVARGFETADPERIAALIDVIDPKRDNTISFKGGTIANRELAVLAAAHYGYLDVRTLAACLRIWPGRRAWVHPVAGDTFESIDSSSVGDALARYAAVAGPTITRGFIDGVSATARSALLAFLNACRTQVSAVVDVELGVARDLTDRFPDATIDWQAAPVIVDFPAGRIHGYLTPPKTGERHQRRWHARVGKALRRAGLR